MCIIMLQNDPLEERAQTKKRAARKRKLKLTERLAVSPAEFAAAVGRSPTYTYRLFYAGLLKPIMGFGRLMISREEADRFLSSSAEYNPRKRKAKNDTPENGGGGS
jgi:hypothetical protein